MADINAQIPLAGKPPVLPEFDPNKLFLTLGQLKYLNAETARTEAQAALAGTQGQAAQAAFAEQERVRAILARGTPQPGQRLTTLGAPAPPPPQPGAVPLGGPPVDEATLAALPQGGSTTAAPAPGGPPPPGSPPESAAPAPQRRSRAQLEEELLAAGPSGIDAIKGLYANDETGLKNDKQALETRQARMTIVSNAFKDTTDQPSWDRALALIEHLTGQPTAHLPQVFSPEAKAQVANIGRSVQQEIEQANKVIDQKLAEKQAETARITAQTGRIEATKPLPAGTGYFQHPDGTWTPMAPQAGAPGALRSPQGQAQLDALKTTYNSGSETFEAGTAAYNSVMANKDAHTNASDQVLIKAFQKVAEPGQAIGVAFAHDISGLGTLKEQIGSAYNTLLTDTGGTLEAGLRTKIVDAVRRTHAVQIDQHLQRRDETRQQARNQGLPPDEAAPNRLTTYGSGNRDKVLTQAQFQEILTHARSQGKTRGEVLLDLADKGYSVRGGPQ